MKELKSATSDSPTPAATIDRARIRRLLLLVGEEMIANLPMTFRAFGPALRSNFSGLLDRLLSVDDADLVAVVDRVRWELRQSRDPLAADPLPLNANEREALGRMQAAIRD